MSKAVETAQQFFMSSNPIQSEDILMNWNLSIIMSMNNFGHRMIVEAQEVADEHGKQGEVPQLMQVNCDINRISTNLKKVNDAYKMAMN